MPLSESVKSDDDVFGYVHLSLFLVFTVSFPRVSPSKSSTKKSIKNVKYDSDDAEPHSGVEEDRLDDHKKATKG
jgi:hypothetical protein